MNGSPKESEDKKTHLPFFIRFAWVWGIVISFVALGVLVLLEYIGHIELAGEILPKVPAYSAAAVLSLITGLGIYIILKFYVTSNNISSEYKKTLDITTFKVGAVTHDLVKAKEYLETTAQCTDLMEYLRCIGDIDCYKKLIKRHADLRNMKPTFSKVIDDIDKKFVVDGIWISETDTDRYIHYLSHALCNSKESYKAILAPPYPPWWLFEKPPKKGGVELKKKQGFVKAVGEYQPSGNGTYDKLRLIVFYWKQPPVPGKGETTFESEFLSNSEKVIKFIGISGSVRNYLLDIETASTDAFSRNLIGGFTKRLEDYVIFDDELVIKNNPEKGLHVIPMGNKEKDYYSGIFDLFASERERLWIELTEHYVECCTGLEVPKLLTKEEYDDIVKPSAK